MRYILLFLLIMALTVSSAFSQYTLSRSNFNAGGGSVSAGNYTLLSNFGHPIEGSEVTAGNYTLGSGFIRTLPGLPTLTTTAISSITSTSASSGGNITDDGGSPVTARGVCWSTTSPPTISDNTSSDGTGTGSFTSSLTGLTPGAQYYVSAYATNGNGTGYGNELSFYALPNVPSAPTVNNPATTSLDVAVNTNGNDASVEYAIRINGGSFTNQFVQTDGSVGGGEAWQDAATWGTETITGLSANTQYTIDVKARNGNNDESLYSSTTTLYTLVAVPGAPTLNNPTSTSLDIAIDVNGNPATTEFAIRIDGGNYIQNDGSQAGSEAWQDNGTWGTVTATGLSPQTQYTIDVKARNGDNVETGFGSTTQLYTLSTEPAVQASNLQTAITTAEQIDLTWTDATGETGYVLLRSDAPNNPSLASTDGQAPSAGANTTIVSSTIAQEATSFNDNDGGGGLTAGQQYNYLLVPYAWDGSHAETYNYLTTGAPTTSGTPVELPTVTTAAFSSLAKTSVESGGNVTADGSGTVSARGVVVGTASGATVSSNDFITTDGTGTGAFTSTVTGLSSATTYYIRAYATNEVGSDYGSEIEIKTLPDPATDVVISNIQPTQFDVAWTRGNGDGVKVFVLEAESGVSSPVNGTDYAANASFGNGDQIGATGWFTVYSGAGTSVTITNISSSNSYVIHVVEYVSFTGNNFTYNAETGSGNPAGSCQNTVWVDASYDSGTTGWQVTHFDDLDDGLAEICPNGTLNLSELSVTSYDGNVDFSGLDVIIQDYDFEITNGDVVGGFVQTPNNGKLNIDQAADAPKSYPLTNDGTSDFTIIIDPASSPTQSINVKITPSSEVPSNDNLISNTLWEIEGETGLDATLTFRIPDSSLNGGTLPENVVFRYWNGTRYVAVDRNNITIVDNGTFYQVTIENVNQF